MKAVNRAQIAACLRDLSIKEGDGLLIHSAVQFLGRPIGGLQIYLDAIFKVIGPQGTVIVPTFNFGFADGEPYHPAETPSKGMGAFSEFIRQLPEARRTSHPLQSIAVIGRWSTDLADRDTLSAFGPGSAFERMLELDFKLLLLGADARAISMFHYCEQRLEVPYRYWKDFTGPVYSSNGWEMRTYKMYVRDLGLNPQLTLDPVVKRLDRRGEWHSIPINYGKITACRLRDFVAATEFFLREDPWSLVASINGESGTGKSLALVNE